MFIRLIRFSETKDDTLGLLFVNGVFECYTLEDEFREVKVPGDTRIPAGVYSIELRTEGDMNKKYSDKYEWHEGMLWLKDVPGFEYIYIHIGNTDNDTSGCILVGDMAYTNVVRNGLIGRSEIAYTRLYKKILKALSKNEEVLIDIPVSAQLAFFNEKRV